MVKLPLLRFHGVFVLFSLVLVSSSAFVAEFEEEEDSKNTFLRRSDGFNDDDENDDAKGRRQSFLGGSSSSSSSNAADVGNRARWLFERSGNVRWSLKNEDDDEETTKSFSLKDVIGARYSDDRRGPAMEVYESTGEFVTMELTFSRTNNKNRATRRSLVNVGGKGAEVGRYFSGDGRIKAVTTSSSVSSSVFALREDGEVLGYDEEKPGNVKNITKPFQESVSVHCTKSKEVFTLFHVNRESSEHQKEKLCAMCLETRRAGGRVIYNGFCAELNEDDGIKVDGDVSSFSYIVSREYEPVAFQAVDDYVVALERQKKNDGMFRLQMFSSKAILVSSKLKSPIEPILAYSSNNNNNKGVDDDQIKVLSLTYSKFNDDDDIAPNAVPNTLGIFTLGVPIGTTTNQTDAIVLRMFNARTEDISATLASAHVTIKWTRILFVVLITIIGCSAMLLCAASAFVGTPKPFLEEDVEANGDVEEQLLDSILEEEEEETGEEEEEEEEEEEKQDKIDNNSKILSSSYAQTLKDENEEEKEEEKQQEEEEDDPDRRLAGGVQAFFASFLFTSSKS